MLLITLVDGEEQVSTVNDNSLQLRIEVFHSLIAAQSAIHLRYMEYKNPDFAKRRYNLIYLQSADELF